MNRHLAILALCGAGTLLSFMPRRSPAAVPGESKTDHAVIEVKCSTQGQTDHRQVVTLTVINNVTGAEITASADLPAHSTSKDFADLLAWILQQKGCSAGSVDPDIYTNPNFDSFTCHMVFLPDGFGIKNSKVEKKRGTSNATKDDHLQVHVGGNASTQRLASPFELTYETFDFSLDLVRTPLVIQFRLEGVDLDDGSIINSTATFNYPNNVLPTYRLQALGQYLSGLGMTVSYPTQKTLHVEIAPSNVQVDKALFMVDTLAEVPEFTLLYGFRAN